MHCFTRLAPLALAISAALAHAQTPADDNSSLPTLAEPDKSRMSVRPGAGSLSLDRNDSTSRFTAHAETSQHAGTSVGVRGAWHLTDRLVFGGGAQLGSYMNEIYANLGLRLSGNQRLMFTGGQLRQKLEFDFPSGKSRAEMTQNSGGISWRFDFGDGLLDHAELNAYTARTASRDLSDATYAIDTATLYELWNDPRRIAGGRVGGIQGKVGIKPWEGGRVSLGLGHESLRYDLLTGAETHNRATASLGAEHAINRQTRIKFSVDAAAAQNRYLIGLDHRFGDLGTLGVNLLNLHGRDGAPGDTRVQVSWTIPLGERSGATSANLNTATLNTATLNTATQHAPVAARSPATPQAVQWGGNLLDQVAARPAWMPSQVIAKRDTTAAPTRLVVVDKTALPAGASIDPSTGVITAPIGVAVTGIAGVTRNAAPFANTGQFALSGNSLVIDPQRIEQPAVGATDVYVVTVNNLGGGTTDVTVNVRRGSVKIVSIVVGAGGPDTTPDAFTFTDVTGQTVSTVVESNAITVAGIDSAAAISITGGEYQINGGAWTNSAGTVTVGQTVKVRHTTSASNSTATNTVLTIGGVSDTFTTTTVAPVGVVPTASAVSISGTVQVGQLLTGSYTYADADGDAQGVTTFRWLRNGVAIAGATASTYTLVNADFGAAITFEVTPVATVAPTTGTAVVSAATAAVTLPAGYVSQGGLIWMPNNIMPPCGWATWPNADAYCTGTTILGQTGWRLPTTAELSSLYSSGAIAGQGWALNRTWSSTPHGAGFHEDVNLNNGVVLWLNAASYLYVSCVR